MTDGPEQAMRVAMRVREAVVAVGTKEIAWGSGSLRQGCTVPYLLDTKIFDARE